jgi:5-formyltetrahydrofolate cyclo-ligase
MPFETKSDARQHIWKALGERQLATYPFPAHGRIPNFRGAREAAANLFKTSLFQSAKRIKVNPDSPQRFVRAEALRRGIAVYVPTPRLAGGFMVLDPKIIPHDAIWNASARTNWSEYVNPIALDELPTMDAIVTGCVAVTPKGKRAGKGAGYRDLEFAILRELGHPAVPVATTVHDIQVAEDFPIDSHDQPLSLIATPTRVFDIVPPLPSPDGIEWSKLPPDVMELMPILASLKKLVG